MKLYLMQHGKAMSKDEDPERPLTKEGTVEVERVAAFFAHIDHEISEIRHSGKRRAEQTAQIVARTSGFTTQIVETHGMNPNDDVAPAAKALSQESSSIMLIGHLPFLSRLAGLLLTGDQAQPLIRFQQGGMVCLQKEDTWKVEWMIIPEIVT